MKGERKIFCAAETKHLNKGFSVLKSDGEWGVGD